MRISICLKPICKASLLDLLAENGFAIFQVNGITNNFYPLFGSEEENHFNSYYKAIYNGDPPENLQTILMKLDRNPDISKLLIEVTEE